MQLVVDVNENLLKEFRIFAAGKHGRLYNALKPEIELALRRHLDAQRTEASRKTVKSNLKSPQVVSDKPGSDSK
jgi:hypothetical protein